jgi:hypothetical protein
MNALVEAEVLRVRNIVGLFRAQAFSELILKPTSFGGQEIHQLLQRGSAFGRRKRSFAGASEGNTLHVGASVLPIVLETLVEDYVFARADADLVNDFGIYAEDRTTEPRH